MRSGFITETTGLKGNSITTAVMKKASQAMKINAEIFKVDLTFYQAKSRYLRNEQDIPREDRGDLDNLIKVVIDGIGPIIGYRKKWDKVNDKESSSNSDKPLDSRIVEIVAKKVNSGSEQEYVGVIIEGISNIRIFGIV